MTVEAEVVTVRLLEGKGSKTRNEGSLDARKGKV